MCATNLHRRTPSSPRLKNSPALKLTTTTSHRSTIPVPLKINPSALPTYYFTVITRNCAIDLAAFFARHASRHFYAGSTTSELFRIPDDPVCYHVTMRTSRRNSVADQRSGFDFYWPTGMRGRGADRYPQVDAYAAFAQGWATREYWAQSPRPWPKPKPSSSIQKNRSLVPFVRMDREASNRHFAMHRCRAASISCARP
jgi:hypothetical protein